MGKNTASLEDWVDSVVLDKPPRGGVLGTVPIDKSGEGCYHLYFVLGLCNYIRYTSEGQLAWWKLETTQKKVSHSPGGPSRSLRLSVTSAKVREEMAQGHLTAKLRKTMAQ